MPFFIVHCANLTHILVNQNQKIDRHRYGFNIQHNWEDLWIQSADTKENFDTNFLDLTYLNYNMVGLVW